MQRAAQRGHTHTSDHLTDTVPFTNKGCPQGGTRNNHHARPVVVEQTGTARVSGTEIVHKGIHIRGPSWRGRRWFVPGHRTAIWLGGRSGVQGSDDGTCSTDVTVPRRPVKAKGQRKRVGLNRVGGVALQCICAVFHIVHSTQLVACELLLGMIWIEFADVACIKLNCNN